LIVFCAVLLEAASNLLAPQRPELSLRLNPLNADAAVAVAISRLDVPDDANAAILRRDLAGAYRMAPRDARLLSLLGIERERAGDTVLASRYFEAALAILPAEIQALTHTAEYALRRGDYDLGAGRLETIARRWPQAWPSIARNLPAILANAQARSEFSRRFSADTALAGRLIDTLIANDAGLDAAFLLAMEWQQIDSPEASELVDKVTSRLVARNRAAQAFTLFRTSRKPGAAIGYVNNGEFREAFSGNPFDWRVLEQSGVEIRRSDGDGGGLTIRFFDIPLRFRNVSQVLRLAPGRYHLSVGYDASHLNAPEPLAMKIACFKGAPLANAIMESKSKSGQATADFEIPANDCGLARIVLANDSAPNWNRRYSGALQLKRVAITSLGN
jgi:tetratricopeptide (TPR) repeat protein